jgi:FAD/FMN-containing dehydrogenase
MLTRRTLFNLGLAALPGAALGWPDRLLAGASEPGVWVNDVHSQLNRTRVRRILQPSSLAALQEAVRDARASGVPLCIAGGRHAMGGQQFAQDAALIDMSSMKRVLRFDAEAGLIEVEAGIEWPDLVDWLLAEQQGRDRQWGIIQKQTGADRLSLGGALAANVHGRGLSFKPIIADVESFVLVDADGNPCTCSRTENAELFRLAIGGYGLFGIIAAVTLRLSPRRKLERTVEITTVERSISAIDQRIGEGYLYGDFQFSTDARSDGFLRDGVFSLYRPVPPETPIPGTQQSLSAEDWQQLLLLAHADKARAFDVYSSFYRATSGQIYWSDTHQMSVYIDDYHRALDRQLGAAHPASEMITEVYVPREALTAFFDDLRGDFRTHAVDLIYGTIRFIEQDDESFLPWARQRYACTVMNLHTVHTEDGVRKAAQDFRRIIDRAIQHGGSYFLTYHRWAERRQVETCYPQFVEFLRLKRRYDPEGRFQSDWYRHYAAMFADDL